MLSDNLFTALIAAGSALGGAALAQWGAARQQARQHVRQMEREQQALLLHKREECLGWVLETRTRMEHVMPGLGRQKLSSVSADKTPVAAARQAYAAALLYLAGARPSAKALYQSTARLQMALSEPIEDGGAEIADLAGTWRNDYEALEDCLSDMVTDAGWVPVHSLE